MRTRTPRDAARVPGGKRRGFISLRETTIVALFVGAMIWGTQGATKALQLQTASEYAEPDVVHVLALDPTEQHLWAMRKNSGLDCISLPGLQVQESVPLSLFIASCALRQNGSATCFACIRGDGVVEIHISGERVCKQHPQGQSAFTAIDISTDGQIIAAGTNLGELHIWTLTGTSYEHRIEATGSPIDRLAIRADGGCLAIMQPRAELRLWDLKQACWSVPWATKHKHGTGLAWSPDGSRIATTGMEGLLRVWDATTGQKLWEREADFLDAGGVAFSPNGQWIVTGGFETVVRLWDAETGCLTSEHRGHTRAVRVFAWTRDSRTLYSSGLDGKILAWPVGESPTESVATVLRET